MTISCTLNGIMRPLESALSTAALAVCASVACQAAESVAPAAQEMRVDTVPDRSGTAASASRTQDRREGRRVSSTRDLFESSTWGTARVAAAAPLQEGRPASPAFSYQYVGRMEVEGRLTVHLVRDEKLYPVRIGDVLDGVFRVEGIKPDGIELTYLPQKRKQFVAFSTITPPSPRQANVATRPEAQPQQPQVGIDPPAVPVGPGVAGVPPPAGGNVAPPGAGAPGGGTPVGGPVVLPPGSPTTSAAGSAPVAPPPPAAEAATSAPPMSISPPVSQMPVEPPTVSIMPTLPPESDTPSGATMATTPSSGDMR